MNHTDWESDKVFQIRQRSRDFIPIIVINELISTSRLICSRHTFRDHDGLYTVHVLVVNDANKSVTRCLDSSGGLRGAVGYREISVDD